MLYLFTANQSVRFFSNELKIQIHYHLTSAIKHVEFAVYTLFIRLGQIKSSLPSPLIADMKLCVNETYNSVYK